MQEPSLATEKLRLRDPILFQVLNSALSSITDEMGAMIRRAAFSLVVSEGSDYSGTISNRHGDLVASGTTDLAAHLGTIPFTVKGTLEWISVQPEEYFRPGDIILLNDPYIGGTHHNDMRAIMPVYLDGRIAAFVQNSAHWTDIGGHVPEHSTPMPPRPTVRDSQCLPSISSRKGSSRAKLPS